MAFEHGAVDYLSHIGRLEHIAATRDWLASTLELPKEDALPHLKQSSSDDYRQHYTPTTRALVAVDVNTGNDTTPAASLKANIAAARDLLAEPGPVGRKFDFLMQEFMREANTLCSKAQALTLTRIGLDLKTVIDQMREQVQNVE